MFVGGVFDMFDGTLARATGQASRLGAFLDSVFDRWGEAIVYLGIVRGRGPRWPPARRRCSRRPRMGAAFMVSYTRAKSEGLGFTPGTGMAAVGLMPREVRLVILSIGLILDRCRRTSRPSSSPSASSPSGRPSPPSSGSSMSAHKPSSDGHEPARSNRSTT